jgi:hypothetical protein
MNERIKELACAAKISAECSLNMKISFNHQLQAFAEHFAELLIQECAGVCISRAAGYHVNHLIPDEAILCSIYIKRHFGVEL